MCHWLLGQNVTFWLKSQWQLESFSLHHCLMAALAQVDWPSWKRAAEDFLRAHPQVQVRALTWGERLKLQGAKQAFAVATYGDQAPVRSLGGQPCVHCGNWTACWCEGCDHPSPQPVCATCDNEHLLCEHCSGAGKLWLECHDAHDEETVEITGFYDENGAWIRVEPALRIPLSEIPNTEADGTFDMEFLAGRIAEHRARTQTPGDFGGTA